MPPPRAARLHPLTHGGGGTPPAVTAPADASWVPPSFQKPPATSAVPPTPLKNCVTALSALPLDQALLGTGKSPNKGVNFKKRVSCRGGGEREERGEEGKKEEEGGGGVTHAIHGV